MCQNAYFYVENLHPPPPPPRFMSDIPDLPVGQSSLPPPPPFQNAGYATAAGLKKMRAPLREPAHKDGAPDVFVSRRRQIYAADSTRRASQATIPKFCRP